MSSETDDRNKGKQPSMPIPESLSSPSSTTVTHDKRIKLSPEEKREEKEERKKKKKKKKKKNKETIQEGEEPPASSLIPSGITDKWSVRRKVFSSSDESSDDE